MFPCPRNTHFTPFCGRTVTSLRGLFWSWTCLSFPIPYIILCACACLGVFVCVHLKDTVACRWYFLAEQFLEDEITEFIHILPAFLLLSQNPTEVMATLSPAPPFGTWTLLKVTRYHLPHWVCLVLTLAGQAGHALGGLADSASQCAVISGGRCSHRDSQQDGGHLQGLYCTQSDLFVLGCDPSKTKVKPGSAWLNAFDPRPEAGRCL